MQSGPSETRATSLVMVAVAFEFSLALLALIIGWLLSVNPFEGLAWREAGELCREVAWGAMASIPLLAVFLWAQRGNWRPMRQLRELLEKQLLGHFQDASWPEFALISLAAGFGEEVLFRGCLQQAFAQQFEGTSLARWMPLVLASLIFGAAHFVSWTYLIVATVVGLYLGGLLMATHSLWVPLTAHAVYDFVALGWMHRDFTRKKSERPDP